MNYLWLLNVGWLSVRLLGWPSSVRSGCAFWLPINPVPFFSVVLLRSKRVCVVASQISLDQMVGSTASAGFCLGPEEWFELGALVWAVDTVWTAVLVLVIVIAAFVCRLSG